jgi:fatty-acyl-CoA synthase
MHVTEQALVDPRVHPDDARAIADQADRMAGPIEPRQGERSPRQSKVYRTELSPLSFLRRSASCFPDEVAVIHGNRGTFWSYRALGERVNRLASALHAAGLHEGDRVAFLCPNSPALLEAHYAVPAAGGILVAINTRLNAAEVGAILKDCGARFLFVDAELLPHLAALDTADLRVVRVDDSGEQDDPYEQFLAQGSPAPLADWLEDEEATIAINYTSGTTGGSKGVLYTYRGAYLNALAMAIELGLGRDSVYLCLPPIFHCNGWCLPWAVAATGGTLVCLRRVDPDLVWELFDRLGVTHYGGTPTVQIGIANSPKVHRLARRVTVPSGGAPPSPTLIAQLQALNLHLVHMYGLTETYAPITVNVPARDFATLPAAEQARLLARQGQGHVTADLVRVVDERMGDVPRDGQTMGEVVMRGNIVMKGYHGRPEATAEAFRGGWFHSGDLAIWHPDGTIELRDRKKDIIISGGENISTIEVEQVVARHPAVLECAVVAIPDAYWGERPKAFVTLRLGKTTMAEEIIAFCRAHLAHYKCPVAVEFGELPKTSTGKVQKYVLREREWVGYQARIH